MYYFPPLLLTKTVIRGTLVFIKLKTWNSRYATFNKLRVLLNYGINHGNYGITETNGGEKVILQNKV